MVLSGVVIELFYFNFLGAWFTHSPWFPLAVTLLLWVINTIVAVHRNDAIGGADMLSAAFAAITGGESVDSVLASPLVVASSPADLIVTLNFRTTISALFGVIVGLTVAWAFQLPPLLDPQLWHVRKRLSAIVVPLGYAVATDETGELATSPLWAFNFSFPRFVSGGLLAAVGANFLIGFFQPEVSPSASLAIGAPLLVGGIGLVLYTLIRWYKSDQPSDWLNAGYALALAVLMVLPAIYDYLLVIRPHQGWLFQLGLAITVIAIALLSVRFFGRLEPAERADLERRDPRYSRAETSTSRIWGRWISLWVPLAIVYAVGWLRDEMTAVVFEEGGIAKGDVTQVLLAVALTAAAIEIIVVYWGFLRWRTAARSVQWITDEDLLDTDGDYVVMSRQSFQQSGSRFTSAPSSSLSSSSKLTGTSGGQSLVHRTRSPLDALKVK